MDYYKKTDIDNMLLSYSTGSYVDSNLANKVSRAGGSAISSNLTVNGNMDSSKKFTLNIKSSTIHTEFWTLASFHQVIANSGSWLQFSRDGTSDTWQAGMSSDNSYVIRASDATNALTVYQNGDTTISGNSNVGVGATSLKIKVHSTQQGYTGHIELHSQSPWIFKLEFITTHPTPRPFIFQKKGSIYFEFNANNQTVIHYKSLVNGSDDRLNGNEELIDNACETLSKLRPQLYDKNQILKTMILQLGIKKLV